MFENLKIEWFSNPSKNILAGIVVALALIPEAIAFSITDSLKRKSHSMHLKPSATV